MINDPLILQNLTLETEVSMNHLALTPVSVYLVSQKAFYFTKYKIMTYFEEEEQKSSHYGLNMLGYTCATRVNTMRHLNANSSKS